MANDEQVEILKSGTSVWNKWRANNPQIIPDLRQADLKGIIIRGADLKNALLNRASLKRANLYKSDLTDANLTSAKLNDARLIGANLSNAKLIGANLVHADFSRANLSKTNFHGARMGYTVFGENDLSEVFGLLTVQHYAPSIIDIQTIYQSKGLISKEFLQKSGVPESFITYMASLTVQPIEFYSCFISYSSKDKNFAERLYSDLLTKGVRCWFAPEDLKIGDELRTGIDESIRMHDRLLLVLSKHSIRSQWVQQEVETALAKERDQDRTVLFPIRLDDTIMKINAGWPAFIRNTRHIGQFSDWKNYDSYRQAFERLLRDLQSEETIDGRT